MTVTITPVQLPDADNANPYLVFLDAAGTEGPFKYKLVSGALPSGLHMADDGGVSGGRAWQLGDFSFEVTAEAPDGQSAKQKVGIKVVEFVAPKPKPVVSAAPAPAPAPAKPPEPAPAPAPKPA